MYVKGEEEKKGGGGGVSISRTFDSRLPHCEILLIN